jgi:hypothetical protein
MQYQHIRGKENETTNKNNSGSIDFSTYRSVPKSNSDIRSNINSNFAFPPTKENLLKNSKTEDEKMTNIEFWLTALAGIMIGFSIGVWTYRTLAIKNDWLRKRK